MIGNALKRFVEDVLDKRTLDENDVAKLQREIMPDGVVSREEIDVLVALDRVVPRSCRDWRDFLVASAVDFVVWQSRPTGHVPREMAQWLVTTLSIGEGPTSHAEQIAFQVVREAESCDEALLTFALSRRAITPPTVAGLHRVSLTS